MEVRSALFALLLAGFATFADASLAKVSEGAASGGGAGAPSAAADCEGRQSNTRLFVQVGQLKSNQGEVAITLYPSDPRRFLAPRGKLLRVRAKAGAPLTQACFYLPRPDSYAVAVYHDANANHEFDRTAVGLPGEGYGFSNDAPAKFGVPAFDAVRFSAGAGDTVIRIKMRYPH